MAEKVFCPHKKIMSRTFIIAGAQMFLCTCGLHSDIKSSKTSHQVPTGEAIYKNLRQKVLKNPRVLITHRLGIKTSQIVCAIHYDPRPLGINTSYVLQGHTKFSSIVQGQYVIKYPAKFQLSRKIRYNMKSSMNLVSVICRPQVHNNN